MNNFSSKFAPARRAPDATVKSQVDYLLKIPFLQQFFDSVSEIVLILNKERQIVFANKSLLVYLKIKSPDSIYGLRPGEIFNCINAFKTEGGCGTTEFCAICGAVSAILNSQKGNSDSRESRISRNTGDSLDLSVRTTPFRIKNKQFTIFSIIDISQEKRRKILERIFFHDVLNNAASLKIASDLFKTENSVNYKKYNEMINRNVNELINTIQSQKIITEAENFDLSVHPEVLSSTQIIEALISYFYFFAKQRQVVLVREDRNTVQFQSDPNILERVLNNMVKNAVEASTPGSKVIIGSKKLNGSILFSVQNKNYIPRKIQLQLFQRSFTTKGPGRGIGTYSMKLLSERYLKGKVTFTSSKKTGTHFTAIYPMALNKKSD